MRTYWFRTVLPAVALIAAATACTSDADRAGPENESSSASGSPMPGEPATASGTAGPSSDLALTVSSSEVQPSPSAGASVSESDLGAPTSEETAPTSEQDTTTSSVPSGAPSPSTAPVTAANRVPSGDTRVIATGIDVPWAIAFDGEVPLVSERSTGVILEVLADGATREVGTIPGVVQRGEGGLLGLAVDDEHRLYVYSTGETGNRIERYDLIGDAGGLALGDPVTLIEELPAASTHHGGRIEFGPDGMLYAGVGDAGEREKAQDLTALSGKILRMTPDGEVPPDNPFPDSLVYSYGHRNVQGITWTTDGTMFASEFGQDTWDELNIILPGGNYGWPTVEGVGSGAAEFIDPVQQWEPDNASPSGIVAIGDTVFIANLKGEVLRAVPASDPGFATEWFGGELGRLRAVAEGPGGTLWLATSNRDGRGEPGSDDDRILEVELVDAPSDLP